VLGRSNPEKGAKFGGYSAFQMLYGQSFQQYLLPLKIQPWHSVLSKGLGFFTVPSMIVVKL
jgi:hypothetical protein